MEISKSIKKIIVSILIGVMCLGGAFATVFCVIVPNTNAIKTGDTTSFVKVNNGTDLWTGSGINKDTAKELFKTLGNSSSADYNTLQSNVTSSSPKSAKTLRGYTYGKTSSQSIVVRLGGLDWIVTYLSVSDADSDNDGNNDIIATLWLSNNVQEAWSGKNESVGKYYGFVNGGLYADWSADWRNSSSHSYSYPNNMYGTSYISTVVLNNGGSYATDYSTVVSADTDSSGYGANNPFYSFTTPVSGARNDLTDFIVTPSNVSWQKTIQDKSLINFSYHSSNDSLDNTGGNWYSSGAYEYSSKTNYTAWGDDYLWLPSLNETGYTDDYDGIWETITSERMTYDGVTDYVSASTLGTSQVNYSSTAYNYAWVRSASYDGSRNASTLYPSGASYNSNSVYYSQAVRPSLHLNLKSVYDSLSTPVTLDQQSGTGGTTTIEAKGNTPLPTITPPTRTGFAFGGYFSSTNGTGTKYYNADGTSAINYPASGGATTLYAYWIPLYTLTINSNDSNLGSVYGTAGSYQSNTTHKIYAITKAGYSLLYWSVKNASGTEINKIYENEYTLTMPAHNITYTAVFGGGLEGINISSTYGGMVAMVGDNFESLSNSDTITLVATVCVTGYQFKHWINQDGTILASGEENKTYLIPKSQAMDSIITAVFEPIT